VLFACLPAVRRRSGSNLQQTNKQANKQTNTPPSSRARDRLAQLGHAEVSYKKVRRVRILQEGCGEVCDEQEDE
jgi:hypothetical protein